MRFQDLFPRLPELGNAQPDFLTERLLIDGAVELIRSVDVRLGWKLENTRIAETGEMRRLTGQLARIRDDWRLYHQNENSQGKVSLRSLQLGADGGLRVSVDETEWSEARPLHNALNSVGGDALRANLLPHAPSFSQSPVPSILGIHGIIETSDNMIVLTQRSRAVTYHPLHWSASFEEQMELSDLSFGNSAFHAAGARGVNEEFLYDGAIDPSACSLLGLLLEYRILNPAIVSYIRIPFTSDNILDIRQDLPEDREEFEKGRVCFVPAEIDGLAQLVMTGIWGNRHQPVSVDQWHPTSRYRLLLGMIHRFGEEKTMEALAAHAASQH